MRRSLIALTVAAVVTAITLTVVSTSDDGDGTGQSGTSKSQQANVGGTLPEWNTDAPGAYKGQTKMPADAKVINTLSGSNGSTGEPTAYKPATIGDGMQVRFSCEKELTDDGVNYIRFKIGTLDAAGEPQYNDDAPSDQIADSWFFNYDWLAVNFDKPGRKPYISVWGKCKWEVRLLTFPAQPLPGQ